MRTLRDELLRLQGLLASGQITQGEHDLAMRERRSLTLTQRGTLAPKRKTQPTAYDGGQPASQQANGGWNGTPVDKGVHELRAPEIVDRDARIAYDRERVAMGLGSAMVRVIKCG